MHWFWRAAIVLACVALVLLWVRSQRIGDLVRLSAPIAGDYYAVELWSYQSRCHLRLIRTEEGPLYGYKNPWGQAFRLHVGANYDPGYPKARFRLGCLGFVIAGERQMGGVVRPGRQQFYRTWWGALVVPHWAGVLIFVGLPARWIHRAWHHRQQGVRVTRGLCVACGYDLTGNASGVCPECGSNAPIRPADASGAVPPQAASSRDDDQQQYPDGQ
jgi:hypothetical protein